MFAEETKQGGTASTEEDRGSFQSWKRSEKNVPSARTGSGVIWKKERGDGRSLAVFAFFSLAI